MMGTARQRTAAALVALAGLTACSSNPTIVLDSTPATVSTTSTPIATTPTTTASVRSSTPAASTPEPPASGPASSSGTANGETASSSTTSPDGATTTSSVGGSATTLPPLTPENAPLVVWNGAARYIHGANLPWLNYGGDFGGGPTGGGVSNPQNAALIDAALHSARTAGMNVVRWWLFPGTPTQFTLDAGGLPTGIGDAVYRDIDAALALAKANDVAYTLTLFSSPTDLPIAWLKTAAGRDRVAQVLGGLFTHYATDPQIMTWDVINEPDFAVFDSKVSADDIRAFIAGIATAVHAATVVPVTVGGGRLDGLPLMVGLGLDYYTIHWYDPMSSRAQCLACVTYADIRDADKIDRPIVVGEFYAPPGAGDRFDLWRTHGYAGALAWSLLPDRTADHFAIDLGTAAAFAEQNGLG